jgi:DNA-binding NarL/FixJ family response regulator
MMINISDGHVKIETLTPRETEVLVLITEGNTSKQIARKLGISFKTAVCHRCRLMAKLDVHHAAGLVRYAVRQKLIEP